MGEKKVSNSLVALGSAAVLAVYTAGYVRTKSAADRFALQAEMRRPAVPAPPAAGPAPVATETIDHAAPAAVQLDTREAPRRIDHRRGRRHRHIPLTATVEAAALPATPENPAPAAEQAPAVVEPPAPGPAPEPPPPPKPVYKDGTYLGWGTSRHGDIQAQVIIQNGRIESATIAGCYTRYSCSVIAKLPPQVAERQSPETDYVSGATQSTNAFYYAVVEALSKAK